MVFGYLFLYSVNDQVFLTKIDCHFGLNIFEKNNFKTQKIPNYFHN